MFVECILESLEREKYVSNIYTWKFGVTLLFMISAPEQMSLLLWRVKRMVNWTDHPSQEKRVKHSLRGPRTGHTVHSYC